MSNNDSRQNTTIQLLFTAIIALGGITAFLVYLQQKKIVKINEENAKLDNELKKLELSIKRHEHNTINGDED